MQGQQVNVKQIQLKQAEITEITGAEPAQKSLRTE